VEMLSFCSTWTNLSSPSAPFASFSKIALELLLDSGLTETSTITGV
jgi:hypothetical protein